MDRMRLFLAVLLLTASAARPGSVPAQEPPLQQGFRDMYNLSFSQAHSAFEGWEKEHPKDPRGPVFNAAAYLFAEFDRLNVLQSEFFVENKSFFDRSRLTPDPATKRRFERELDRGKSLADSVLQHSPNDKDALLANVVRLGLHADYLALIEKQNMAALTEIKLGRQLAQKLLQLYPTAYDAYLAAGVENYLLSQKAAPVRWLLHFGGAETDRQAGLADLKIVAAKGQYLRPYAELLLAVAALREGNKAEARRLLNELATDYPHNPLYREELKKISG